MPRNVLVVDDDPGVLETIELLMEGEPFHIQYARGGADCLARLREGFSGLVLMDIMMPGMDGWQTIAAIRDEGLMDGCFISMLTALSDPGPALEELKEEVLDYVRKPFTKTDLLAALDAAFDCIEASS